MITAYTSVEPNLRPAYVRLNGPYKINIAKDQTVGLSFFDHTQDTRLNNSQQTHRQMQYWTFDFQKSLYELHFIDQKELDKNLSEKFKCSFDVVRTPEFGTLKIVEWFPMYDKLEYRPALGYQGSDSFTVRPVVPRRGFKGHTFTFQIQVD
ncbi:hypothetical protein CWB96_00315 [Pseudoalteromonas citrea]|uniref:Uncharacterized protein n=1 Tax=Pseudoalteromonas citrea TaxID=43655 RepID=A0A5S3XW67_9GAMM|nr:hypothetical protein [Pseudoalteromonas citrea]TMP46310.1 hypothetical protein CWB97_02310 [Pseudoalteromonas citrea]TMP63086.1 hypothetical protein CWB96_00315 [Pseudoalteromonas citrea]